MQMLELKKELNRIFLHDKIILVTQGQYNRIASGYAKRLGVPFEEVIKTRLIFNGKELIVPYGSVA